jgi:hypothetical protein
MTLTLPSGLPARHAHFLILLAAQPSLTRRDYQRLVGVSQPTAKRDLTLLANQRLIVPLGRSSARRYALGPGALVSRADPKPSRDDPELNHADPDRADHLTITFEPLRVPSGLV